jgi:hypothetical protein
MSDPTIHLQPRPVQCPHCGHFCRPDETHCSQCDRPLTLPVQAPTLMFDVNPAAQPTTQPRQTHFEPRANALLQITPSGTCISLSLEKPMILGRGVHGDASTMLDLTEFNALQLGISRRHCILKRRGHHLMVADLGSANGTYLNAEQLEPSQEYVVGHGDTLMLGQLRLTIFFTK